MDNQEGTGLFPPTRLREVAAATGAAGIDAVLLTPGPDLRYVTGYEAHQLERLTCLVIPADGAPFMVVPRLEVPAAQASRPAHWTWRLSDGTRPTTRTRWSPDVSALSARSGSPTGCGR